MAEMIPAWNQIAECDDMGRTYIVHRGPATTPTENPKPFLVIDGQVYINQSYVKESTIEIPSHPHQL